MTQLCAHGLVLDKLGHVQQFSTTVSPGPWPQKVEYRTASFAAPPENFVRTQRAVFVTVEHRNHQPVGRLASLERNEQGLWATCVLDELQLLREPKLYYSAEIIQRGNGNIELTGLSVVADPGAVCTRPLELYIGSLTSDRDRARWRLQPAVEGRIERAAGALERRSKRHVDIIDIIDTPKPARLDAPASGYRSWLPTTSSQVRGQPVPPQSRPRWRSDSGSVEWSAHPGKVLSVR